jgi:hypothetical protein
LLNDTLASDERRDLETHLQSCASCRDELARQRQLMALYAASPVPEVETDSDAAFARVMARLQTDAVRTDGPRAVTNWANSVARGWRIAFAVQMCVIVALGVTVSWTLARMQFTEPAVADGPGTYRGLAAPAASVGGDAIIIFDPRASEADLRRVLQRAGARIVDGPTAHGAYVVRFAVRDAVPAVKVLRADGTVLRVEILSAGDR